MSDSKKEFERLIHGKMDGAAYLRSVELLTGRFPGIRRQTVGYSVLGRPIELLTIGQGEQCCLYVGTHHGMESITTSVLLAFAWQLAESGADCGYRYAILPMLNPDGADLCIHGIHAPILAGKTDRIRTLFYMQPDGDFSRWQANVRGVDLNHNYDAGFVEYRRIERERGIYPGATKYAGVCPESEPESRAVADWIRCHLEQISGVFTEGITGVITEGITGVITEGITGVITEGITGVITLHTQGRVIYYSSGGTVLPGCRAIAERLATLTGYSLSVPEGTAAYGGLTDWLIAGMGLPSFTLECGLGQNPLPMSDLDGILTELLPALTLAPGLF